MMLRFESHFHPPRFTGFFHVKIIIDIKLLIIKFNSQLLKSKILLKINSSNIHMNRVCVTYQLRRYVSGGRV